MKDLCLIIKKLCMMDLCVYMDILYIYIYMEDLFMGGEILAKKDYSSQGLTDSSTDDKRRNASRLPL
jgi:hypothetical protein